MPQQSALSSPVRPTPEVFEAMKPENVEHQVKDLKRELAAVERKIANLTAAVENGNARASLVAVLRDQHADRDVLLGRLAGLEGVHPVDRSAVEARVNAKLDVWRRYFDDPVTHGRQLLCEALTGPLMFTVENDTYSFKAPIATGEVVAGANRKTSGHHGAGCARTRLPMGGVPSGRARYVRTRTRRSVRVAARRHGPQGCVAACSAALPVYLSEIVNQSIPPHQRQRPGVVVESLHQPLTCSGPAPKNGAPRPRLAPLPRSPPRRGGGFPVHLTRIAGPLRGTKRYKWAGGGPGPRSGRYRPAGWGNGGGGCLVLLVVARQEKGGSLTYRRTQSLLPSKSATVSTGLVETTTSLGRSDPIRSRLSAIARSTNR